MTRGAIHDSVYRMLWYTADTTGVPAPLLGLPWYTGMCE